MTALHVAAQAGKTDLVRYLLEKGADTEITDASGRKAIDLAGGGGRGGNTPPAAAPAGGGGGPAGGGANPTSVAEIRTLLENAASRK